MDHGYIQDMSTDDELASAVGHEVAHLLAGHHGERRQHHITAGLFILPALGFAFCVHQARPRRKPYYKSLVLGTATVAFLAYQYMLRIIESEANDLGLLLVSAAGYNPEGVLADLQRLHEHNNHIIPRGMKWTEHTPVNSYASVSVSSYQPVQYTNTHCVQVEQRLRRIQEQVPDVRAHIDRCAAAGITLREAPLPLLDLKQWHDVVRDGYRRRQFQEAVQ